MKKNNVALISGCSSGIGEDIAYKLAQSGWLVLAGVRKQDDFDRHSERNDGIRPILLDVTRQQDIDNCLDMLARENLSVDVLINNAGIAAGGPIETTGLEEWRRVFEVNVFGLVNMTSAILPHLRRSKGRIINVSSISGLVASPFMSVYASSKFSVEAFSDSLRRETKDLGIRVSILEPGPIQTRIWEKGVEESAAQIAQLQDDVGDAYRDKGAKFKGAIDEAIQTALPVSATTNALYHACTSQRPKTRYVISKTKFAIRLIRMLPDSWADKLILSMR